MSLSLVFSPMFQALLLLLLFLLSSPTEFTSAIIFTNETDKLALLDFKSHITSDPFGVLSSWNESLHFCNWVGVTCSSKHERVTSLYLNDQNLAGTISSHIGNLSFLDSLSLSNNSFYGGIPAEVSRLIRLQSLNLSRNFLDRAIPINLSHCPNLIYLDLRYNHLMQEIPFQIGTLSKLVELLLYSNDLTGRIPPSIGNLTALRKLSIGYNHFEGKVPDTVGEMKSLTYFRAGVNNLSGEFPTSLYNLSSLEFISLTENNLVGSLRPNIGLVLPNLQVLYVGGNNITGFIPVSLSNATNLMSIDVSSNNLMGNVPLEFGSLKNLYALRVDNNHLGSYSPGDLNFISSLTNCTWLYTLNFGYNQYAGELPVSIGNLSTGMTWLTMGGNSISGSIPDGIANLVNLTNLCLQNNMFTGNIPTWIGNLPALNGLSLQENKLTGHIPSSMGNLTQLSELDLHDNFLEGSIPTSLANCQYLRILDLSQNKLSGTIPNQLVGLPSISVLLNLSYNSLSGPLPPEVGKLIFLVTLDVSNNKLSGVIPSTLGSCVALETLYLQGNFFQGSIPQLVGSKNIKLLDLSRNNLSGQIPNSLWQFSSLQNLNLSINNLDGEVPEDGIFKNASAFEVFGNSRLCGGIQELRLRACPAQGSGKPKKHIALKLVLPIASITLFFVLVLVSIGIWWMRKSKKPIVSPSFVPLYQKVSYQELRNATGGFSPGNLVGSGSFGTVYKGILGPDEPPFAVKVLNLQQRGAIRSFVAECETLRNIRHRNLVKVLTACSSIDFERNEFRALVFEFMPKGSLETWLHPEDELKKERHLSLLQRINIAIDVASALHYLHHQCQTAVIHCDLKPSNVLLDNDMTAHVSDFGLATILSSSTDNRFSSLGVKGTVGYAAPEYGMGGEISASGDVYSYGILLLEIFTGRRPTDGLFKDDLNLHKFAKMALPNHVMEIVDLSILSEAESSENSSSEMGKSENSSASFESLKGNWTECLVSIIKVGVSCSSELPRDRMSMREVALELLAIRDKFSETVLYEQLNRGRDICRGI